VEDEDTVGQPLTFEDPFKTYGLTQRYILSLIMMVPRLESKFPSSLMEKRKSSGQKTEAKLTLTMKQSYKN
jgi:hypothetical protein